MKRIILNQPGRYTYTLDQEGSHLEIIGRFWLKTPSLFNLHLIVVHAAPHTSAYVSLKAVVGGRGEANLQGTLIVQPQAPHTNSFLEAHALLLSPHARAHVIPNLEISHHQVKCSHAATVGKPNPEDLFYLMSRGLSKPKATHLIARGFLALPR